MLVRPAIAVLACAGAAVANACARDWPHLRGPTHDGVSTETNLADSWPADGPPVLWRIPLGQGYSGFTAVDDRLFTQYQSRSGQYVVCLDANTGATLWQRRYGWPWQPEGEYPGPYATPTWHAGRLYCAGTDGWIGCLDATNGRERWSVNVTQKFRGRGTEFGYACSLLVVDGKVIVPVGGPGAAAVALDADDGTVVWKSGDEPASYCSPYPVTLGGRRLAIVFLQNSVAAFDPATGRQVWRQASSEGYDEHAAMPLYREPHLMTFAPFHGGAKLFRLAWAGDDLSAELVWESTELSNDIASSVRLGDHVYGFDIRDFQTRRDSPSQGTFKCIEFSTGAIRWATDRVGHATVVAADGKLILLNDTGTLLLARATASQYEELARSKLFEAGLCWTAPTLQRGRLFARNQREAVCVWLGDGSPPVAAATVGARTEWHLPGWSEDAALAPDAAALWRWYGWSLLGVFAPAMILGAVTRSRAAFTVAAFVLGAGGTIWLGAMTGAFVFTWPAALFVAFWFTAMAGGSGSSKGGSRWIVVGLLLVCGGYYWACRHFFLVMGWGFFIGLLAAFPVAAFAARRLALGHRFWREWLWMVATFTAFFWSSALFVHWKMHQP